MAILDTSNKPLNSEKILHLKKEPTFCLDCVIDWCKIRNTVSYCTQKYKGISCYACSDDKCSTRKIAGS